MAQTLNDAAPAAHVAEVVYHGEQLILPSGMEIPAAIKLLKDRQEYLETEVNISETYNVFPWDGANAVHEVLTKLYGWANSVPTPGFFGPRPPAMLTIDVSPTEKKQVPWGAFSLPGVKGRLSTGMTQEGNRLVFALQASVLRKDEATIRRVFDLVAEYLRTNSIYRGKAVKVRFLDDDGDQMEMPEIKFMQTGKIWPEDLIYSKDVEQSIGTNLFTPIQRVTDCIRNGIPVKRGVLLGGVFGTGKTLAATAAASIAVATGVTYVYVPRADELKHAIEFAKQYQSPACVIFCEDIDRVMAGDRSVKMDDILNVVDGIDTKDANLITVLTTNALENINAAMLRPGRLDAVIEVTAPDADAVQRLLRMYGGATVAADADLSAVGRELDGCIPAVVAEVVQRAKLAQLKLQAVGTKVTTLTPAALLEAAKSMRQQINLLARASAPKAPDHTVDSTFRALLNNAMEGATADLRDKVQQVYNEVR